MNQMERSTYPRSGPRTEDTSRPSIRGRSGGTVDRAITAILLLVIAALPLAGCAPHRSPGAAPVESAPANPASAAQLSEPLPRDSSVIVGTLENGLRYYIRANQEPRNRVELRLAINAGSVLEDEDQRGLAHMVEHMAFNGTKHFSSHELVDYLESVGMRFGPDVNAYVSFDETVYMLTLPTDSAGVVETGLQILEDWAHGITFDPAEVEKERGVVIEEWRLRQGAEMRVHDIQFPTLLQGSRYPERLPIGTRESLDDFDHEAMKRFYRDWYRPDLMAVIVVGDIEPKTMEARVRAQFGAIPPAESPRERPEYTVPEHPETLYSIATDPELTGSGVAINKKQPARTGGTAGSYRRWLVELLAGSILTDRLLELTQRPDAPIIDVSSFQGRFMRPTDAFVLNARVHNGGIEPGLKTLLTEMERISRHGVAGTEADRKKSELLRMAEQRHAERDRITSSQLASEYSSHFLYGGEIIDVATEYALYQRFLPGIGGEEIEAVVRGWLDPSNRVITASGPTRPDAGPPGEAGLAAVVEEASAAVTEAYADAISDAPFITEIPEPAAIVAEREYPEVGVYEWTLANGVRVLLKPTDFQDDLILLGGRSPGGTSLVPDEDYVAAMTATAVVQAGGLGALSSTDLQKRLAGKLASVGTSIDQLSEHISGAASSKDLETLFQLVYLRFTEPRLDSTAIEAYRARARVLFENRGASPEAVFQDTVRATLAQHHPRARPLSAADFEKLDIDRSFEIFHERFGDAGDFTFYIVGTFEPDSLRPLVRRYLGGLPAAGRAESWRDLGIRAPAGVVHKTVRKGLEPKGNAQIIFTGEFDFDRSNLGLLSALGDLLRLRLREQLREELGGTYGVSVSASGARDPRPEYRIAIGFGADPDRLEELAEVVLAEIDSIQRFGPTAAELAKVREMQRRSREVRLRENQFWIARLMSFDQYGWDLNEMASADAGASVTASGDEIREAARLYLDQRNYVRIFLVPETGPGGKTP